MAEPEEEQDVEKLWKEKRRATQGDDEDGGQRRSKQLVTAVLLLSRQKDREAVLQLRNLKSALAQQQGQPGDGQAEGGPPAAPRLTEEEKRLEKEIEKLMELNSAHSSAGSDVQDKLDLCGTKTAEGLADCCFRVGFIQIAMGVLSACAHILLSFTNEEGEIGFISEEASGRFSSQATIGNAVEALAYGIITAAGIVIISAVGLRKKWLAALHFGLSLTSPFLFLSVITIVAKYGTTFGVQEAWLDGVWIAIHVLHLVVQVMFATFSWRLWSSMDTILTDDQEEEQRIFNAIERDEDAFRQRPRV